MTDWRPPFGLTLTAIGGAISLASVFFVLQGDVRVMQEAFDNRGEDIAALDAEMGVIRAQLEIARNRERDALGALVRLETTQAIILQTVEKIERRIEP